MDVPGKATRSAGWMILYEATSPQVSALRASTRGLRLGNPLRGLCRTWVWGWNPRSGVLLRGEWMGGGMQFLGGLGVICLGGIAIGGSFGVLWSILWSIFLILFY